MMYFYKNSDGTILARSDLPISRYIEITEEEYNSLKLAAIEAAEKEAVEDEA